MDELIESTAASHAGNSQPTGFPGWYLYRLVFRPSDLKSVMFIEELTWWETVNHIYISDAVGFKGSVFSHFLKPSCNRRLAWFYHHISHSSAGSSAGLSSIIICSIGSSSFFSSSIPSASSGSTVSYDFFIPIFFLMLMQTMQQHW